MPDNERLAQLVVEVPVGDLERSMEFYGRLGFFLARRSPDGFGIRFATALDE